MKYRYTLLLFLVLPVLFSGCNYYRHHVNGSDWVLLSPHANTDYGSWYFRRTFRVRKVPRRFEIKISADKRYKLFVNGEYAGTGPQLSDLSHWKYDSYDIASYLEKGSNLIAVEVDYFGRYGGMSMISARPAFWFSCDRIPSLNTPGKWQYTVNKSRLPVPVVNGVDVRGGFLAPACDSVIDSLKQQGWNRPGFSTDDWTDASIDEVSRTNGEPLPWKMEARNIPHMEREVTRFERLVRAKGPVRVSEVSAASPSFTIPPHTHVTVLFDNGLLTAGFPELHYSKGKNATVRIRYAESLYARGNRDREGNLVGEGLKKGNRDMTLGKVMVGYHDVILPDGRDDAVFTPSWFRTYRYVRLEINTAEDSLRIDDFHGVFTAYPFEEKASFSSDNPGLKTIWETAWRTARLCAWETYMDCPYYEQLQYVGDTRIQALISLYVSGDDRLMRNALLQFSYSADSTGLTSAAYPGRGKSIIPPFSLFWTLMVHDYYMMRDDSAFVFSFLDKVKGVLDWHKQYLDPSSGMLADVPYWNFVDWTEQWPWIPEKHTGGVPAGGSGGRSSILSLQYAWALKSAAGLFAAAGRQDEADQYMQLARDVNRGTFVNCWDEEKNMLADSPEKTEYSQHANILAVITGLVPAYEAGNFIERIAFDKDLVQATIYYRFFLDRALEIAGRGDLFLELLDPWEDMLKLGLTTFAEKADPTRSDCHGWSASPNYEFLATVCGIKPNEPGFKSVLIQPSPGNLQRIEASMPHPEGIIRFRYEYEKENGLRLFSIDLPEMVKGRFVWNNKEYKLEGEGNEIRIEEE
ncbi:MAG TPA: family 78 glycoside hydrolase catalytic domain [Bacteroidales bacterium]|nr:family 78 glycoside hydrolase catalytic domain [Bacteroidales bacterium]